jgi:hypothetical protein
MLFSVTHESPKNSHLDAANYDPDIVAYMADFDPDADLGSWVNFGLISGEASPVISVVLDTINFNKINVTGWPLQFGHMFVAFNDHLRLAKLDHPITVEFDIRVRASEVRAHLYSGYSGRRIMVGAVGTWDEAVPRTNKSHFLEVDLIQSDGYSESYGDPKYPLCRDVSYDRCFYSVEGKYAEGRELRYETFLEQPSLPENTQVWTRVRIPLADVFRRLHWVSAPSQWGNATVTGVFVGIESEGATRTWIEVRNYHVHADAP